MMSKISMIVAVSDNLCIGRNNDLPWVLPGDLKNFKYLTSGKVVIMGRKSYESIGRPLPNRINVIISRNKKLEIPGCVVFNSLKKALISYESQDIFIIGGAEIYYLGSKFATEFYITRVSLTINDGTTFLNPKVFDNWCLDEIDGPYIENDINYRFEKYVKDTKWLKK